MALKHATFEARKATGSEQRDYCPDVRNVHFRHLSVAKKKNFFNKLPTLYVYFVAHFFCNAGLGISTHMFIPKINRSEGLLIACTAARIFFGKKYMLFISTHMNKSMVAPMCFGHGCEQL